ncbi:F-box/kelch-repeat protein At3g06240-like [Papaver somniferum]|uniref:F-box/kelch-repeat protein At3g06240-like n=1 Tax=Papaver somniferum TaxID=3469 RepID=UPI000E6FF603|nr:F-box/kelch-repeat protein At3g06240-like [Papaver somniferum]
MSVASRTRSKLKEKEEARLKEEEKLKHEEAMSLWQRLPEGLPDKIFLKLPGNSIFSSRSVCKLFKDLLSEPIFIKNHVNLSIQTKTNPKLLYGQSSPDKPPMIYSVPMDYASISLASAPSSSSSTPLSCEFRGAVQINYPFESKNPYNLDFLGSCNGLICFKISRIDKVDSERGHVETNYFYSIYDYKLVAISDNDGCSNIDVYTVKSDSWNSIKGTVNYSFGITGKRSHGVFFNGALHWLASKTTQKTSSEVVVCFDISSETMLNMSLPENIMPPKGFCGPVYKNLGVWGAFV